MNKFAKIAEQSESHEAALIALHEAGASPIEAIKSLMDGRGLSLADGKSKLGESPVWKSETAAADQLHEEIVDMLDKNKEL